MNKTVEDEVDSEERQQLLLARLKEKIAIRKKKLMVTTQNEQVTTSLKDTSDISSTPRIVAEGKSVDEFETVEEENKYQEFVKDVSPQIQKQTEDGYLPEPKKKKKKKKRKVELSSSDDEDTTPQPSNVVPGEGFTILGGGDHFEKKPKVRRVLPDWLRNPSVVSVNLHLLTTTVDDIPGIDPDLIQKLKDNNITHFFPVQCQVIPWLLSEINNPPKYWPRDICVSAPTGSGKTLAFVIPIIQALKNRVVPCVRALVVLPVQELAVQVMKVFEVYSTGTSLKVALITGENSFAQEQRQLMRVGLVSGPQSVVDIVITTTGRIVDHIKSTPGFSLKHLRYLVIDEADRIMENMANDWLHHLNKHIQSFSSQGTLLRLNVSNVRNLPRPPQKLLFSATLSQDPEKLQQLGLFQPKLFTSIVDGQKPYPPQPNDSGDFVGKYTTPAELVEKYCVVTRADKPLVLYYLVTVLNLRNILCFLDTQKACHNLTILLSHLSKGRLKIAELSAAHDARDRLRTFNKVKDGEMDILVCTDAMARGIDLTLVDYVISYSPPKFVKNYIHRIGRTARAGRPGTAITFIVEKQKDYFYSMVTSAGKNLPIEMTVTENQVASLRQDFEEAVQAMKKTVQREHMLALEKVKAERRNRKQVAFKRMKRNVTPKIEPQSEEKKLKLEHMRM